jgi:hypothetical protein
MRGIRGPPNRRLTMNSPPTGCQEVFSQAAARTTVHTSGHYHRQAWQLFCSQDGGITRCAAHTRQASQQSRGEFPSANAGARTSHERLQVSRARPGLPRTLWSCRVVLSSRSPFTGSQELSCSHAPTLRTMERSDPSRFRQPMIFFTATNVFCQNSQLVVFSNLT